MKEKIKEAEKMCLNKYGVNAKITLNLRGWELGIDEPIYYKAQARMVEEIKKILEVYTNTDVCTDIYVL